MAKYKFPSALERHFFMALLPYFQDDQRHCVYGAAATLSKMVEDMQYADHS
jgi:hypothetical protein